MWVLATPKYCADAIQTVALLYQAPFDVKALLAGQLVDALLRWASRSTAHRLVRDTIAMLPFQNGTIFCAVASFFCQNALCFTPFYYGSKPWALANIGRRTVDFIHDPLCIALGKTLVT